MIWAIAAAGLSSASAVAHLLLVLPRLPRPDPDGDDPPPDYVALATPGAGLVAGAAALLTGLFVLPHQPTHHLLVWVGYLGAGAALVWVDLRTTWLPKRLNLICLVQVLVGVVLMSAVDWRTAVFAVAAGLLTRGFFHLVWRLGTGLGYGDVRLAGIVGIVAGAGGVQNWLTAILMTTIIGAIWALVHAFRRRGRPATPFPYGPALWLGPIAAASLGAVSGL